MLLFRSIGKLLPKSVATYISILGGHGDAIFSKLGGQGNAKISLDFKNVTPKMELFICFFRCDVPL